MTDLIFIIELTPRDMLGSGIVSCIFLADVSRCDTQSPKWLISPTDSTQIQLRTKILF